MSHYGGHCVVWAMTMFSAISLKRDLRFYLVSGTFEKTTNPVLRYLANGGRQPHKARMSTPVDAAPKKKIDAKSVLSKFVIPTVTVAVDTKDGVDEMADRFYKLYHLEGDEYTTSKEKYLKHRAQKKKPIKWVTFDELKPAVMPEPTP